MKNEDLRPGCDCCTCDGPQTCAEYPEEIKRPELFNKEAVSYYQDSERFKWAKFELDMAGFTEYSQDERKLFRDAILELMTVFCSQGHSGGSAMQTLAMFNLLIQGRPLSPLTFEEKEWNLVGEIETDDGPCWQNCRCSSIFKTNKGIYDIDLYRAKVTKSVLLDGTVIDKEVPMYWSSSILETKDGVPTGRLLRKAYIADPNEEYVPQHFDIECIEVEELVKDNWEFYADEKEIAKLEEAGYRIDWDIVETKSKN